MSETHYTQGNSAIFIQPDGPGGALTFLGCHEIASIDEPLGDYTPFWCPDPKQPKRFVQAGQTYAPPAATTLQIVEDVVGTLSLLREQKCPFGLYVNLVKCGTKSVFANAELTWVLDVQQVTNRSTSNVSSREGDERMERAYDLSAAPPVIEVRSLEFVEQTLPASPEPMNDIIFCNNEQCATDCGTQLEACEQGIMVADGAVAAAGEVVLTTTSGVTWTNAAASPFAVNEDVLSATCYALDKDTTRWLVARGQEAAPANPAEVAYSDDSGATWTVVNVEAAGTRSANDSGALFSLDWHNIWFATTDGYVHFSTNGGATWTNQYIETGGNNLNAIHFADENNGYVVGASGIVSKTDDGGSTWVPATATTGTPENFCVHVFDADRVMVGADDGNIYLSIDGGTAWTAIYSGSSINDITFVNDYVGFALDDDEILRTRNGGLTWESVAGLPALTELNSVWACNENLAYAVGEDAANAGIVFKVSG